eukprot:747035-Hanusia_phi.AAC.2
MEYLQRTCKFEDSGSFQRREIEKRNHKGEETLIVWWVDEETVEGRSRATKGRENEGQRTGESE